MQPSVRPCDLTMRWPLGLGLSMRDCLSVTYAVGPLAETGSVPIYQSPHLLFPLNSVAPVSTAPASTELRSSCRPPDASTPPTSPQRPGQRGLPRVMYPRDFGRVTDKDLSRRQAALECAPTLT